MWWSTGCKAGSSELARVVELLSEWTADAITTWAVSSSEQLTQGNKWPQLNWTLDLTLISPKSTPAGKSEPENSEDWDEKLVHAMNQNKPVMPEFSKENGEFSCLDCPYSTVLLQNMKNHWIFHNPTLYECKACGIEHSSAKFLRRHIKENHDQ